MVEEYQIEETLAALRKSIADYNDRYGYLGANWEKQIEERYDDFQSIAFDVYFDSDMSVWVCLDAGGWNLSNYLGQVAEIALEKAEELLEDGWIESLVPEFIEMTF